MTDQVVGAGAHATAATSNSTVAAAQGERREAAAAAVAGEQQAGPALTGVASSDILEETKATPVSSASTSATPATAGNPAAAATAGPAAAKATAGLPKSSSSSMLPGLTLPQRMNIDRDDVIKFLKSHSCYDFMPESGKVVVLDVRISVKLAFFALVEHELTYAPLWDEVRHNHVGMLTSTDLIQILEYGYMHNCVSQMFAMTVGQWLELNAALRGSTRSRAGTDHGEASGTAGAVAAAELHASNGVDANVSADQSEDAASDAGQGSMQAEGHARALASTVPTPAGCAPSRHECMKLSATRSLYDAVRILHANRKQRVSIIDQDDTSTLLQVLTNHRLLLYLVKTFTRHVSRDHPVLEMPIRTAGVGCHDPSRVVTVRNTAPLIEVLHALVRANISSVPIVDAEGRVVDVYSRQDAMYLTRIKKLSTAHLNATVVEVLKAQCLMLEREGLHTCSADDSLGVIIQRMAADTAHRLVIVDSERHCVGLVSVSDIFRYFLD